MSKLSIMAKPDTSRIVVSVPGSGTRFVKERLNVETSWHTWENWDHLRKQCDQADVLYIPIRQPQKVFESWVKNGRFGGPRHLLWYKAWYQLNMLYLLYPSAEVICVDKKNSELIKDWRPVGQSTNLITDPQLELTDGINWQVMHELPVVYEHYGR